jgi:hypothetical protein
MTIIYRAQKGAPLTMEELDGNFKDLDTRLERVEEQAPYEGGISQVILEGDELVIQGPQDTTVGRVRLPMPQFLGRGEWQDHQDYSVYALVRHETALYLCLKAHQSTHFDQERHYWQLLWQPPKIETLSPKLPLFISSDLPASEPGTMGLLIAEDKVFPIYGDGKAWRRFSDHQTIGE